MSIAEQLRNAIQKAKDKGASENSIAKAAGVSQPTLFRFVNGSAIGSENIDRLAEYFGLKLCRDKKTKGK